MEKNTKILIGVGIAAVAAYFVYRSKSKKTQTGDVVVATNPQTGDIAGAMKCPEGTKYVAINCIKAPCPKGECVPMDMMPQKPEPSTEPSRGGKLFGRKTPKQPKTLQKPEPKEFDPTKFGYDSIDISEAIKKWQEKNKVFADDLMMPINYKAELQQA